MMKWPCLISTYALVLFITTVVQAQVVNGSFENDPNGLTPSNWLVTGGSVYVSDVPDCLFPSSGNKYLIVDAYGTGPTTAGYGPHGWNFTGQARQTIARPPGQFCFLSIDWEFLPSEVIPHPF